MTRSFGGAVTAVVSSIALGIIPGFAGGEREPFLGKVSAGAVSWIWVPDISLREIPG